MSNIIPEENIFTLTLRDRAVDLPYDELTAALHLCAVCAKNDDSATVSINLNKRVRCVHLRDSRETEELIWLHITGSDTGWQKVTVHFVDGSETAMIEFSRTEEV